MILLPRASFPQLQLTLFVTKPVDPSQPHHPLNLQKIKTIDVAGSKVKVQVWDQVRRLLELSFYAQRNKRLLQQPRQERFRTIGGAHYTKYRGAMGV